MLEGSVSKYNRKNKAQPKGPSAKKNALKKKTVATNLTKTSSVKATTDTKLMESITNSFYVSQEVEKKKAKEKKLLEELNQIWQFLQSPLKGSVMDVYDYLQDIKEGNSTTVSQKAESMLDFLDSTRMRGW